MPRSRSRRRPRARARGKTSARASTATPTERRRRRRRPTTTTRALTIKPFKRAPAVPEAFASDARAMLRDAIAAVQEKRQTRESHETLYRAVENLCVHKRGDDAFEDFRAGGDARSEKVLVELEKKKIGDSMVFLRTFDEVWGEYCAQALTLRSIFLYLDRARGERGREGEHALGRFVAVVSRTLREIGEEREGESRPRIARSHRAREDG